MASIVINVGRCNDCQNTVKIGSKWDREKRHNCNNCGYYQNYDEKLVVIKYGTVKEVY